MPGIDETVIGAGAPLSRAEQLKSQLDQLAAAHGKAKANGKWSDAALLYVDYRALFAEWCVAEQGDVMRRLEAIKTDQKSLLLRLAWWHHLDGLTSEPQEVSPVQRQILQDGELEPRSWAHARDAIETREQYRLPLRGDLASWMSSSTAIRAEADSLQKYLTQYHAQLDVRDYADASWETYSHEKEPALTSASSRYDYLWEISGFVP